MTRTPYETADELETLAAELVSLATFAGRAPSDQLELFHTQAASFEQRANAAGYPSIADGITRAKKRPTWRMRAGELRDVAAHARRLADELRQPRQPTASERIRAGREQHEQRAMRRAESATTLQDVDTETLRAAEPARGARGVRPVPQLRARRDPAHLEGPELVIVGALIVLALVAWSCWYDRQRTG